MKLILLILLSILFSCKENSYIPSPLEKRDSIIFTQTNYSDLPFIKTKINNKEVYFLLDTGADQSLIDLNLLNKYGLIAEENLSEVMSGIGGIKSIYNITNLKNITINETKYPIEFKSIDLKNVIYSLNKGLKLDNLIGILGSDFFEENGILIDYRRNYLFITK